MEKTYGIRLTADSSGFKAGLGPANLAVDELGRKLAGLKSLALGALSFAGVNLGGAAILRMADEYGQLMARLKLVTSSQNEFNATQQRLFQVATETRAPLAATIDLYSKLAPSVKSLGGTSAEAAEVVQTVSQAIALSGASAEASQAAIIQFGQALASGVLRGDEFNSIIEQTPALAQALANGLGVPRGKLRELAEEGELTSARIISALKKVAPQVSKDFESLPVTVGQSFTLLGNEITKYVGRADQATGATRTIAGAVQTLANNLDIAIPVLGGAMVGALALFIPKALSAAAAAARVAVAFAAMNPIAAVAAVAAAAAASYAISKAMDSASKVKGTDEIAEARKIADERSKLEQQLYAKRSELRLLLLGVEIKSEKEVREETLKTVNEQIEGVKRLKGTLQEAWQTSIDGAREALSEAKAFYAQAATARSGASQKAADRLAKDLPEDQQQRFYDQQATKFANDARDYANFAQGAALDGRAKQAQEYAAKAAELIKTATDYADKLTNNQDAAALLKQIGEAEATALEAQGKVKEQQAVDLEATAQAQQQKLQELDSQLDALQAKAKAITLEVKVQEAIAAVAALQNQIDQIKDKAVTLTVNTVNTGGATGTWADPSSGSGGANGSFASGGWTGPGGKYDPAGIVHANEFVTRTEVVNQPGALRFLSAFNLEGMGFLRRLRLPGFAEGGLVSRIPSLPVLPGLSVPSLPTSGSSPSQTLTPVNLVFPGFGEFRMQASQNVAKEIEAFFRREALAHGRRI